MELTYPFGKQKGQKLEDVSTESLMYLVSRCDINDPKYASKNRAMVDECNRIINSRTDKPRTPKTTKGQSINSDLTVGNITLGTPPKKDITTNAQLDRIEAKLDTVINHLGLNVDIEKEESGEPF